MKQWKQVLLTTIHSEDFEKDWDFLLTLQKEQAPWLSEKELEKCVVESVIKLYGSHKLDWLYFNEESEDSSQHSVAA